MDKAEVRQALRAVLGALSERSSSSRFILDDPHAYGMYDPDRLQAQIHSDEAALVVLQSMLDDVA